MKRMFSSKDEKKLKSLNPSSPTDKPPELYDASKFDPPAILFPLKIININLERLSMLAKTQKNIGLSLYTPSKLNELLTRKDICVESVNNQKCKAIRFVIKENGDLIFGNEGYPDMTTPAHSQMIGDVGDFNQILKCVTAGNAYFDDKNQLVLINHKSGDFRPSFASLKIALTKFIENNIPMNDTFVVAELTSQGGYKKDYLCNKKELTDTLKPKNTFSNK